MATTAVRVIDTIDWSTIACLMGDCRHVPAAIEALKSPDSQVRHAGVNKLDNHVVVQGGLFEGAFYIVPFLIDALRVPECPGRLEIYDLLFEIANGGSGFDNCVTFRVEREPFVYFRPDPRGDRVFLELACRFAVARFIPEILDDVEEAEFSRPWTDLLGSFREHFGLIEADLEARWRQSTDKAMAWAYRSAIAELRRSQ